MVDQLVPPLGVGSFHESLRYLRRRVSSSFLDCGHERLGLGGLCAVLRLLLSSALGSFKLADGIEVVELCSQLHEAIEACEMKLV